MIGAGRSFDRYVVVDWSAASTPRRGTDSIWIAELDAAATAPILANPPTRRLAEAALAEVLARTDRERLAILVDATLGLPAGGARALGFGTGGWRSAWVGLEALIADDERNRNNRFEVAARLNDRCGSREGPFWGAPNDGLAPSLRRTKPPRPPLPEFRATERLLRARRVYPKSVWQLLGAGSVGSQTLTIIPVLERLRRRFSDRVDVWPFTTGLIEPRLRRGGVLIAEVWPTLFGVETPSGTVRDAAEVAHVASTVRSLDRAGRLAPWWVPEIADERHRGRVEREEGWVFGPIDPVAVG